MKVCGVDGCNKKHEAWGMCKSHYMKERRLRIKNGTCFAPEPENLQGERWAVIPESNGLFFISSLGRVKSIARNYGNAGYKILKSSRGKVAIISKNGKYRTICIAPTVIRAFKASERYSGGKYVFLNGDNNDFAADNLEHFRIKRQKEGRVKLMESQSPVAKQILEYMDGNEEAISPMVETYWPKVSRNLRIWARHFPDCDVDNFVQEGFIQALDAIKHGCLCDVENPGGIQKWFYVTARNLAINDHYKRKEVRMTIPSADCFEDDYNIVDQSIGRKFVTSRGWLV